jgi:HEPN domain-containing protein
MKKQVEHWLLFAERDLKSAKLLLNDETLTTIAAFHCQQAVEKGLKAIFENQNLKIPRLHNLEILYQKANIEKSVHVDLEILQRINEVYIDSRYPSDIGLIPSGTPSSETIQSFIDFAEVFLVGIRSVVAS